MTGFYWIYIGMLALTLWYHFVGNKEQKRLIYWGACGFLLLIFVAQDSSVSVDTAEYMKQYEIISTLSFGQMLTHKFEIGYVLLCRILVSLFESRRMLLLAMGLLILVPFARTFEEETEHPMIALMAFLALGMYQHGLIFWRQLAAMAIMSRGYRFVKERKFWRFLGVVLLAMTFHKMAIVFILIYFLYALPVSKWLLFGGAALAIVGGVFCQPIMSFILTYVYEYHVRYHFADGGQNLLAALWIVVLLSYWLLRDRMEDGKVKLPFLMVLTAAALQPVCFAFYNWLRVVLFFRIALVALCAQLYGALFAQKENNRVLDLMRRYAPKIHARVLSVYDKKGFQAVMQLLLFGVLFVWYLTELDGAVYVMAPLG